ncbi:hypothetical protein G5714_006190 [Onychostoma macrolepis]|uniref:Uncharacterized protein n=1 Tax=Onychostoma macrolepis TaxID=369639 RepID=A0A7J6D357_9TELE|nr:hypothetical protein G5714_006190 [Onychostoma macrolepis]
MVPFNPIGTWCTEWEVFVAPIRDPVLLGLDFLQAANITIRQRSEFLQKSKDTPDNPIMQEPLHEPEPPAFQGSSETESISSDPEPQENQDKERKRQPAARRRRKKLGVGLMSDIGEQETIKKTHKGREIRKPARYNS